MAKKQKTKILAMALCASVMAGIYASPVMAADLTITLDGQGIVATENAGSWLEEDHPVTGTLTIGENALTTALSGTELTLDSVTANTISTTGNAFTVDTSGDVIANSVTTSGDVSTGSYTLNSVGAGLDTVKDRTAAMYHTTFNGQHLTTINGQVVAGGVTLNNGNINTTGTLVAREVANTRGDTLSGVAGDVDDLTLSVAAVEEDVNTINNKTQNINASKTIAGETYFDGKVIADKFGTTNDSFYVTDKGELSAANNKFWVGSSGEIKAANGNLEIKNDGDVVLREGATVDGVDVSELSTSFGETNKNVAGIVRDGEGEPGEGTTIIEGGTEISANVVNGNTYGQVKTDTVLATTGQFGDVVITGDSLNNVGFINGAAVSGSNGALTISGVELNNGSVNANEGNFGGTVVNASGINANSSESFKLGQINVEGRNLYNVNNITASGTINTARINGVAVSGNSENGLTISDVNLKNGFVDGVDISELNSTVEGTTTDITELQDKTQNIDVDRTTEGTTAFTGKVNVDGSFSAANGTFNVDNDGNVTATEFTASGYNLTEIGANTQSIEYNNGVTTIGGDTLAVNDDGYVTINNGAFSVGPDGMVAVGGDITLDGGTGVIEANDLRANDNVYSANYDLETVGANLGSLEDEFDTTNANVGGIERTGSDEEGWTTTIEDHFSVSDDGSIDAYTQKSAFMMNDNFVSMGVTGQNGTSSIMIQSGSINLTGDVNYQFNGAEYNLQDLTSKVEDIYDRTQGISYDEETGTTTVDGDLNVKGDAATGEGGNLNAGSGNFDKVATDEVAVGDKTYIDGDSVNSVNGNFENITADKGTIGGVTMEDGTVSADKVVTGNTTLDNEGLNVGGNTSVTSEGVNVGGAEGTSIKHDEIIVGDGGYIGGGDVVSGEGTSLNDTANRVGNLEQGVSELNNRVGELEDRIDKVGAMAAAIANLRTMGYDPAAPTEVAVGLGQYRDETGAALGLFHYPNRDFMLSLSVSTAGDEVMGGIGATWKFGRKSPEKVAEIKKAQAEADVRRAEAQKLAKAEEMKQAAKEAKIKAQQERHAKLAAERAAQAEAAK